METEKIGIKELKEILKKRKTKPAGKYAELFLRPLTFPFILFCVRNKIPADIVTLVHILIGVVSVIFILIGGKVFVILGIIFMQLWFLTDLVDGDVARFREEISVTGIYYDMMSHYFVFPLVFIAFGIYGYHSTGDFNLIYLTLITSVAILLKKLVDDCKLSAITVQCRRDDINLYSIEDKKKEKHKTGRKSDKEAKEEVPEGSTVKKVLKGISKSFYILNSFPSIMNVVCLVLLYEVFVPNELPLFLITLSFYTISLNFIWVWTFYNTIKYKKVDSLYFSIKR